MLRDGATYFSSAFFVVLLIFSTLGNSARYFFLVGFNLFQKLLRKTIGPTLGIFVGKEDPFKGKICAQYKTCQEKTGFPHSCKPREYPVLGSYEVFLEANRIRKRSELAR